MTGRIVRHVVPIDDQWHELDLPVAAPVLHVEARHLLDVELWVVEFSSNARRPRRFRVFAGGSVVPATAVHVGSALAPCDLVWHLFEDLSA